MDHRSPLTENTVLPFPGMPCHIQSVLGRGSNSLVYRAWYPDALQPENRHHVILKELFPFSPRGEIYRKEDGSIWVEPAAQELFDSHRESFEAGNRAHLALLEKSPQLLGGNLNSFSCHSTLYTALDFSGGESLASLLDREQPDLEQTARRMLLLLDALEAFHQNALLHLDISPDNILVTRLGNREHILLIDYNSVHSLEDPHWTYASFRQGYSAPEVEAEDISQIGFPADLYAVAAVFYRCLTGHALTLEDTLLPVPPSAEGSSPLEGMPQTVRDMVRRILARGLYFLPEKRYRSTGQLRRDLQELLDRIHGVGITHWALWENGRTSLSHFLKNNPALDYLRQELLPLRITDGENRFLPEEFQSWLLSPQGRSVFLHGEGGSGKTTALLRCALGCSQRYSPRIPALFYIPLGGWKPEDRDYIKTYILLRLKFPREHNTLDKALPLLVKQLDTPLSDGIPCAVLLLDGLNEVQGNPAPLLDEIRELAGLAGLRILAAGRTMPDVLPLADLTLSPLDRADVAAALEAQHMLLPSDEQTWELLRSPLILTLYITARDSVHRHTGIRTLEELWDAYLSALLEKAVAPLPENDPHRWQLEGAVRLLLPALAARLGSAALPDRELLPTVKNCYDALLSGRMIQHFSGWIGRTQDILHAAKNAEDWYGQMLHRILWQELGLLVRQEEGYRICHQSLGDRLANSFAAFGHLVEQTLDGRNAENVLGYSAGAYAAAGHALEQIHDLLQQKDPQRFEDVYGNVFPQLPTQLSVREQGYIYLLNKLSPYRKDPLVSWSRVPFRYGFSTDLICRPSQLGEYYTRYLPVLKKWIRSPEGQEDCPNFPKLLEQAVELDARITGVLFDLVCAPHIGGSRAVWQQGLRALVAEASWQECRRQPSPDPELELKKLQKQLNDIHLELNRVSIRLALIMEEV